MNWSAHLSDGSLVRVLEDWCPPFAGYHLYYPSRRQPSPAFSLVVRRCDSMLQLSHRPQRSAGGARVTDSRCGEERASFARLQQQAELVAT